MRVYDRIEEIQQIMDESCEDEDPDLFIELSQEMYALEQMDEDEEIFTDSDLLFQLWSKNDEDKGK